MRGITRREWFGAAAVSANAACNSAGSPVLPRQVRGDEFYKGVNFTAERPHHYGTPEAAERLAKLPDFGVNAVALVPYAGQRRDSSELRFPLRMERDEAVAETARQARAVGLKVFLKPQIWVRGGYPGDLDFPEPEARRRWYASYKTFVEHYADLATRINADLLSVGVEFAKLSRDEERWRELITVARAHFAGPLVYSANFGEEFENITFWDALDFIGLDQYYPLPNDLSTDEVVKNIERVHEVARKPVLLTEAGFVPRTHTHAKPWETEPGGDFSLEAQAAGYQAVFQGLYNQPWLQGIFWWKLGTSGGGPRDDSHRIWGKPAMDVMGRWYRGAD